MSDDLQLFGYTIPAKVVWFVITLFGATVMYMFALSKKAPGSVTFLQTILPGRTQLFYDRLDFLVVVFVGSIIGTIFFHPTDALQALSAGFGWIGALNLLVSKKVDHQ
ncbi:MAG: hypothetical protein ACLGJB_17760 [Blastocatellia bacterium]